LSVHTPSAWRSVRLADCTIGKPAYGANTAAIEYDPSLPRYLRITDISDDGRLLDLDKKSLDWATADGNLLQLGDIVFARSGATVGKTYLHESPEQLAFAGYLIRFRPDPNIILPRYLFYLTKSPLYRRWVQDTVRSAAQPNINAQEYQSFGFLLPPIPGQQHIADILATWNRAIEESTKRISLAERLFSSMIASFAWPEHGRNHPVRLNSLLSIKRERVGSRGGLTVYSVTRDGLVPQAEHFNKRVSNEDISRHMYVERGDFVLSGLNFWLGSVDVSLVPSPICISPDYKVFRLSENLDELFFRYVIRTHAFRAMLKEAAVERASVVRKNFDRETFLENEIPLPPLCEQRRIAAAIRVTEHLTEISRTYRDELVRQRDALASELLTDRLRVHDAARLPAAAG
jgi:type I restriction enzyme S subunit